MIRGLEFGEHSGMGLKDMGNLLGDEGIGITSVEEGSWAPFHLHCREL